MFYKGHLIRATFETLTLNSFPSPCNKGLKISSMYLAQNFHVPVSYKVIFVTNISSCPNFDLKCVCKP